MRGRSLAEGTRTICAPSSDCSGHAGPVFARRSAHGRAYSLLGERCRPAAQGPAQFASGQISVWVDGELAYSGNLVGSSKRKFGVIPVVQGSLSETLPVATGTHQVKVQVVSDSGARESTISGDFAHNGQRGLSVTASRDDLSLNWQPLNSQSLSSQPQAIGAESSATGQGWFSRYAGTLVMTVAGSIISALAGFALRELPKHLVSRPGAVPERLNNHASQS
jgi:hypothetical protein